MRWLVGDAVGAMSQVATTRPDLDGYDKVASAILTLCNGGMASFHQSWASHVGVNRFGIIGAHGSATTDWGPVRWRQDGDTADRVIPIDDRPEDAIGSHQRETRHFVECLRTGTPPLTNVYDGVATVKTSHAVLESSRTETCGANLTKWAAKRCCVWRRRARYPYSHRGRSLVTGPASYAAKITLLTHGLLAGQRAMLRHSSNLFLFAC